MINEILQSINQKNRLYKTLVHTDTDNTDLFNRRKDEYKQYRAYLCSILTKGSTCRKNKKLRLFLILIEQVMTNLLKKN